MQQQLNLLMENKITLYGASGHGKVVIDLLKSSNIAIKAVVDDAPTTQEILSIPVEKAKNYLFDASEKVIISIGNNKIRKKLSTALKVNFTKAIHPHVIIAKDVKIGLGTVVMAGVIVNADVEIGEHCIINSGAIVEHDCKISDFVHVSPGVSLAGNVIVEEGVHLGIGCCVIQGIKIGKWATVGAGTVVIRDVPPYAIVVGNPGKIIKYNSIDD